LAIKPGILPADAEEVGQEIHFEHIQAEIIEEGMRNTLFG
jgi:hypothetical protein